MRTSPPRVAAGAGTPRPRDPAGRNPRAARMRPPPAPVPPPLPAVSPPPRPAAKKRVGAHGPSPPAPRPAGPRDAPARPPAARGAGGLPAPRSPPARTAAVPEKAPGVGGYGGKAPLRPKKAQPGPPLPAGAAPGRPARGAQRKRYSKSDLVGTDSLYLCLFCYEPLYVGTDTAEEACFNRGCVCYASKGEIPGNLARHGGLRHAEKLCTKSVREFCRFSREFVFQKIHETRAAECAGLFRNDGMNINTVASMDHLAMRLHANTTWGASRDRRAWRAALRSYCDNFDMRLFIEDNRYKNYIANPNGQSFVIKYHHALNAFLKTHCIISVGDKDARTGLLPFQHIDKESAGGAPKSMFDFGAIYKNSLSFAGALNHVFKMHHSTSKMYGYPAGSEEFVALLSLWLSCPPGYAKTVTEDELREVYEGATRKNKMAGNFGRFLEDYASGKAHAPILIFDGNVYRFDYATLLLYLVYLFSNNSSRSGTQTKAGRAALDKMRQVAARRFEAVVRQKMRADGFDAHPREGGKPFRPSFDGRRREFDCVAVDRGRGIIVLVEAKYEDIAPSSAVAGNMVNQMVLDKKGGLLAHAKSHHSRREFFKRHFGDMGRHGLCLPGGLLDYTVHALLVTKHEPLISRHMSVAILSYEKFMSIDFRSPSVRDELDGAAAGPPPGPPGAGAAGGTARPAHEKERHRAPEPTAGRGRRG